MSTTTTTTDIDRRLDEFEERLPRLPSAALRLQRAAVGRVVDGAHESARIVTVTLERSGSAVQNAARTVTGTARRAVKETSDVAATGVRRVRGQSRAQGEQTVDEVADAVEAAADAVEDRPTGPYETWTREELYERAQELDIDGRSTMNKDELVSALRSA